jgi:hypothetical protein
MISRESLHQLVDNLPGSEILRAERVLQALKETVEIPPLLLILALVELHVEQ